MNYYFVVALMTTNIRSFQEIMEEYPRNKVLKVKLKELIDKRKKFLKYLRRWDYKRFEWIIEKLDIVYKSPPAEYHQVTRKGALRKLTDIHCENIRQERLKAYREELDSKKIEFLQDKIVKLQFIQDCQKEYKIPITVTDEKINASKELLKALSVK